MKYLDFIIWMCLYPVASTICDALTWQFCERITYSANTKGWAALVETIIYFCIASALWKKCSK